LIGVNNPEAKRELLETIRPQFLVLKPSLLGGFMASQEWIEIALELKIGWWINSALESNIGLNAIAQWTATLNNHNGSGTGNRKPV
jgi:O-succinylbenzoate synthase